MRTYELMVIHRPELAEDDVRSGVDGISRALEGEGAAVSESNFWGKRRFAYEINHLAEGYYSVVTFQADAAAVDVLDRALSLSDAVVRHKFVRRDAA